MFKSSYHTDVSVDQWQALTSPELLDAHLGLDRRTMEALRRRITGCAFRNRSSTCEISIVE
jgi:hypothetical protein